MRVPRDTTTLISPSGDVVNVKIDDDGGSFADILEGDVRLILNSGLSDCVLWRELNPTLTAVLGEKST